MPENVPGITCRQSRKMIHNCSIGYTGGKRIIAENPGNWEAFKRLVSTAARHR